MTFKLAPWSRVPPEMICLIIALLLLFPVAISSILKDVYFFELVAHTSVLHSSASGSVRFGVWGYCWSGLDVSVFGLSHDGAGGCSPHRIGYRVDPSVAKALHVDGLTDAISFTLSLPLVLHVIDSIFVALAIICVQVASAPLGNVVASRSAIGLVTLTFPMTWAMFFFDYNVGRIVGNHISVDGILQVSLGCGVWLVLTAAIMLTLLWLWAVGCVYWRKKSIWSPLPLEFFDSHRMVAIKPKA